MRKSILRIDASMRKQGSYSRQLADSLLKHLTGKEDITVRSRDLAEGIPFINEQWINANFTPGEKRTSEQRAILAQSDALVSELQEADEIVIALPVYNFSVPAAFKAWIDLVARVGLTFHYTENGPVGLLANKKAYVILTSGGTQMGSEIDFASGFARHVLGFIGITDVTFIDGSGVGQNEQKVLASAEEQIYSI